MCRAAGTPRNRSTVGRVPLPMIPATVRQSIRQAVATVRPCAAPPEASAVRPCAASGLSAGKPWRPFDRAGSVRPVSGSTVGRKFAAPPEANAAGFATIEHAAGFRQAVRPVSDSGDRVPRPACQRFDRGEHRNAAGFAATVRRVPLQMIPATAPRQSIRQPFDRVPPDSGQCRRILPAVCATVGRPACYRGNRSRLARLFSPETRRNRPPLRPPAPDGFAPALPCRALARPFNAA